jgi:probable HAF family extracellular repeat protein
VDLGTLGGPNSNVYAPNNYAAVLNNTGVAAGWAETSKADSFPNFCSAGDCLVVHAFETRNGHLVDLGALKKSLSSQALWIGPTGLIAGVSENGQTDPLASGPLSGLPEVHGVVWRNGAITDLGTLPGGTESSALAVNSLGQVVGAANSGTPYGINEVNLPIFSDEYGWTTPTRAFFWQNGKMQDLGTLGGTDAVAYLVNDLGQVVGASYVNSELSKYEPCAELGFTLTTASFLWENEEMKNLGGFGGTCTVATDLNNQGTVVGISALSGDQRQHAFMWQQDSLSALPNSIGGENTAAIALNESNDVTGWASVPGTQKIDGEIIHAAIWVNGAMTDLGTVDGDPASIGFSINSTRQVVGISGLDFSQLGLLHGFLWEENSIVDLTALIPSGSPFSSLVPETINDSGEIAGTGFDADGNAHAFLMVPCAADDPVCTNQTSATQTSTTSTVRPTALSPVQQKYAVPGSSAKLLLRRHMWLAAIRPKPTRTTDQSGARDAPENSTQILRLPPLPIVLDSTTVQDSTIVQDSSHKKQPPPPPPPPPPPGRCTPQGMECPPQFPPCCAGLTCVPESTRAFCLRIN